MLIYESDGFLEVDAKDISQLCRSNKAVSFGDGSDETFELHAVLCEYQDNTTRRCRAAFYAKSLKRALVFTVSDSGRTSAWKHGQDVLAELGFKLDAVNLKLSPAMLDVVLRDVPGLSTPAAARTARTEEMQEVAELQRIVEDDPDSPQGKRAALKLSASERAKKKLESLRQQLEATLASETQSSEENEALLAQVRDLAARLEDAEKRVEEERSQKEFSETITAAAEKRIQELEEILVDVETKSSSEIKLKRKIATLQAQVKELEEELLQARDEAEIERARQGEFVDDVKSAQSTISTLEASLKEKDMVLDKAQERLEEGLSEREALEVELKEALLQVEALSKDLEEKSATAAKQAETVQEVSELNEELAQVKQALEALGKENETLLTEKSAPSTDELDELQARYDELAKERDDLKNELEQEASVRKRLERGAAADEKKITELEKALAARESAVVSDNAEDLSTELAEVRARLTEEENQRAELEADLDDAHKMIDSLEKMIREREAGSGGWQSGKQEPERENSRLKELGDINEQLENQLEQEQIEQKKFAKDLAAAQQRVSSLEDEVQHLTAELAAQASVKGSSLESSEAKAAEKKKLPHELRPAPRKDAFFHPDWDLDGLPCKSAADVLQAWETVFNVQISIEGYPTQYCMAFLVLLREGKQKRVYLLYRLKTNKHTLVCVPAKVPKDDKSLKKAIAEAMKFLKISGFEMEEMAREHIDVALKSYYIG